MNEFNRRSLIKAAGASAALLAVQPLAGLSGLVRAAESKVDSLPMQLYRGLSDEQRQKICLPVDHQSRQFISNWWYVHKEHRIPDTFDAEQQELIQNIFDSLHRPEFQATVNKQVEIDQYGAAKNAPSVGFFGSPDNANFEFIYTGHHVTRRCNAHSDTGMGFGGAPIFYGHFPDKFNETKDHPGNPYWYQGKLFNEFVQALSGKQQEQGLVSKQPRSEKPGAVIRKTSSDASGLSCAELSKDQKKLLAETMRKMMSIFREDDVTATIDAIEKKGLLDRLHVSWFDGKYDIGSDKVWDTWQIEGPEMVWYFRGQPHIHSYFHLKS
jgi:hypothetical protein